MSPKTTDSSFAQLTGDLYARWTLDCVVDIAYAVSRDFVARPEFYKRGEVSDGIVDLRMEYGTSSELPNPSQRQEIASPVLGGSEGYTVDGSDKFRALRKPLFDACSILSERSVADSAASMRQAVLSALQLFQPYLMSFDGESIRRSYRQITSISDLAFNLLRSPGIAQVFGVSPPPMAGWPIDFNDSNGALLIRAIGEKLPLSPQHVFSEEKFQRLRRVAQQGRDALVAVLSNSDPAGDRLDPMITSVYTWAISLRDYGAH